MVWSGDDGTDNEVEIYGRRLSAAGEPAGPQFRISDLGPNGATTFGAFDPAVAYNPTSNEYLVVWSGDDGTDNEFEIFAQRLSAAGVEVGTNDQRISDMGPNGATAFGAFDPAVAYNPTSNEYLVVWSGDDGTDNEFEIFAQRLSAAGVEVGTNDQRISAMGPDGSTAFGSFAPAAAASVPAPSVLVAWHGDTVGGLLGDNEFEIYARRLAPPPAPGTPPVAATTVRITSATVRSTYRGRRLVGTLRVRGTVSQAATLRLVLTRRGRAKVELRRTVTARGGAFAIAARLPARLLPGSYLVRVVPVVGATVFAPALRLVTIPAPRRGIVGSAAASAIRGGPPATAIPRRLRTLHFRFRFLVRPRRLPVAVQIIAPNGRPTSPRPIGKPNRTIIDAFVSTTRGLLPAGRWRAVLLVGGTAVAQVSVRMG